ncbi:hypothetical protein GOP47_0006235 [Adiantum capillus-veneris]|uniref:Uncharacterized protein n=1 Tax=Adiantum capillus-veneris TaxID=13818 RepID=A0A9D4ZK75_ADICA|nr:hypothetical protein GOP47_0006235 [Adiantum capillus-veneris]
MDDLEPPAADDLNCSQEVRHKHMFPQDLLGMQGGDGCPHELPVMKRSRSDGKLPLADGLHIRQPHRQSLQAETLAGGCPHDLCNETIDLDIKDGLFKPPMPAFISNNILNDLVNDEDEDGFHEINLRDSISGIPTRYAHANDQVTEEIKYCIRMEASTDSKANLTIDLKQQDACSTALLVPQKKTPRFPRSEDGWQLEYHGQEGGINNVTTMLPLAVVSTGDAVLFFGSNLDELHLIPSKVVPPSHSPPPSPRMNLSPLKLMSTCNNGDGDDDKVSNLSVEDIMALLESDDVNEDELLSLLINTKSPSMSPRALSPTSMLSISSVSTKLLLLPSSPGTSLSPSPMSSSSSSPSSSSPPSSQAWLPSTASTSCSQSLLSSMPSVMLPFSTSTASASRKASPHCSSSRKILPTSSFEFKVKSCNSAASTPMFSPIRSTVKPNITQLKPTALTSEEIAEIWGVFEGRKTLITRH